MILLTGGTGYIGSHICVTLMNAGYEVVVLDDLSNSHKEVLDGIARITGGKPAWIEGDINDKALLTALFRQFPIHAVMHCAGLKAVGDSVVSPLPYYHTNVGGTLTLLSVMQEARVHTIIFSSSATVYGNPDRVPVKENAPLKPQNPYGLTKHILENMLEDIYRTAPYWRIARLRYFNPVGAHESGLIGENPKGEVKNLMPYLARVALGMEPRLTVYGNDYPTPDGTGIRDYIHVCDLAEGHVAALQYLQKNAGIITLNLGTGQAHSVFEIMRAYERSCGKSIPYKVVGRRAGDLAEYWADPTLASQLIGWKAMRSVDAMCADSWRWANNTRNSINHPGFA